MPCQTSSNLPQRCSLSSGFSGQGSPPVPGDVALPSELPQENQDVFKKLREMKLGAHIDHAHSISVGRLGEKYYLMIVIDGIDFVWPQTCQIRTHPEDLLHEFLTMSHLKISTICFDDASEFGKSSSFIAYYTQHDIVRDPLASYTHTQKARAEGTIRIYKKHVRYHLRLSTWEKLDHLHPHELRHNLVKDVHVFGSYVMGHLPRTHPHVADTTHDDRAEEGVFLGNDLTTTNFWMYSFRVKKVMMLSDPKRWGHILPFKQPGDVPHKIALTDTDICVMHTADDHEDNDVSVDVVTTRSQVASKLRTSGELPAPSAPSNSGEKVRELSASNKVGSMTDDMLGGEQVASSKLMLQDYKKFKHGKEVPQEAEIHYLKPHLLAQALVHHKHVIHMPNDLLDPNPTNTVDFIMLTSRAYSIKNTWYIEYEVTGLPEQK
jgi:hypothetical protein